MAVGKGHFKVDSRLRRMAHLLGLLAAAVPPPSQAKRKRIEQVEASLAELVRVFGGWREAMRTRKRRGRQRLRLVAG